MCWRGNNLILTNIFEIIIHLTDVVIVRMIGFQHSLMYVIKNSIGFNNNSTVFIVVVMVFII